VAAILYHTVWCPKSIVDGILDNFTRAAGSRKNFSAIFPSNLKRYSLRPLAAASNVPQVTRTCSRSASIRQERVCACEAMREVVQAQTARWHRERETKGEERETNAGMFRENTDVFPVHNELGLNAHHDRTRLEYD
jgi:hypothetical protein